MSHRPIKFRAWDKKNKAMFSRHVVSTTTMLDMHRAGEWVAMQFTGLHDKNGKEVFEGDVVRWSENWLSSSSGEDETFIKPVEWKGQILFPGNLERTEVIGNIYENPELLKL